MVLARIAAAVSVIGAVLVVVFVILRIEYQFDEGAALAAISATSTAAIVSAISARIARSKHRKA